MGDTNPRPGYPTPEDAALAGWSSTPAAAARVLTVSVRSDRAEVMIETDQSDRGFLDYVYCVRSGDSRWREVASGNGPTTRWDDPSAHAWGVSDPVVPEAVGVRWIHGIDATARSV